VKAAKKACRSVPLAAQVPSHTGGLANRRTIQNETHSSTSILAPEFSLFQKESPSPSITVSYCTARRGLGLSRFAFR
jgi:hypothetical protein